MKTNIQWAIAVCVLGISLSGTAEVPQFINYQGRLLMQDGTPMVNETNNAADGQIDLTFRLYDAATGGNIAWSQVQPDVAVYNGLFSVLLSNLNESHFPATNQITRWLEVEVRYGAITNILQPRKEIVSVAYAIRAADADKVDGYHASELRGVTNEVDPTVTNWVKDGVSWVELRDIAGDMPAGFKDGIDDVGITNWVHLKAYGMPAGFADDVDNVGITNWVELITNGMPACFADGVDDVGITNEVDPQVGVIANNYVPRWDRTNLITGNIYNDPNTGNIGLGTTNPMAKLDVDGSANIGGPLSVRGILSVTETNIIEVMGTNILTIWPHTSVVTNLNADRVDGKHASELGGITNEVDPTVTNWVKDGVTWADIRDIAGDMPAGFADGIDDVGLTNETDPQVGDNTPNYVPRWNGSALIKGSIYDPNTGNIGIGTTSSVGRLHVVAANDASLNQIIFAHANGDLITNWRKENQGSFFSIRNDGLGRVALNSQQSARLSLGVNTADGAGSLVEYLSIINNGNVGIGTTSPGYKLQIASSAGDVARIGSIDYGTGKVLSVAPGDVNFDAPGIEGGRMKISGSTGNIGIGTAEPGAKLDVNGIIRTSYSTPTIQLLDSSVQMTRVGNGLSMFAYNDIKFGTLVTGAGGAMTILQGGNVGIGTPSPAAKLDVNGHAMVRGTVVISGGDYRIQAVGGTYQPFLALDAWSIYGSDTTVLVPPPGGFLVARSDNLVPNMHLEDLHGHLTIRGNYFSGSDDRLKFNEQRLEYGLAQVMALEPKRYDRAEWEVDPETEELVIHPEKARNEIGLVAQEVQRVIPEAVDVPEDEDHQLWSISYETIIPVLVKAIQEQQAQIEALKQENQTLKSGTLPDIPLTADFDGDGKTDRALVDSSGNWYFWLSSSGFVKIGPFNFGVNGKPVVDDFDGDGKADPGIVSASGEWYVWLSASGYSQSKL